MITTIILAAVFLFFLHPAYKVYKDVKAQKKKFQETKYPKAQIPKKRLVELDEWEKHLS